MNTYKDIPDAELFDMLVKYTDWYTHMIKGDKDMSVVRALINDIITELKIRKEVPGSIISAIR